MFGSATSNRLVCTRDKVKIISKIVVVKMITWSFEWFLLRL